MIPCQYQQQKTYKNGCTKKWTSWIAAAISGHSSGVLFLLRKSTLKIMYLKIAQFAQSSMAILYKLKNKNMLKLLPLCVQFNSNKFRQLLYMIVESIKFNKLFYIECVAKCSRNQCNLVRQRMQLVFKSKTVFKE